MRWDDWRPADAYLLDAFEMWRAGDHADAERRFEERIARDPDDPDAWRGLGSVRWSRGRYAEAREAFQRALHLEPTSPMHWHNVGLAFRDLGEADRALACLSASLELDPRYEPAWNELANVHVELGKLAEAEKMYRRAIALAADRAVIHHNLGVCLRLASDVVGARRSFERALALDPEYRYSIDELARLDPAP
jgi:Tfp pilus assembly protein PilF